jgi:hypothetical protein
LESSEERTGLFARIVALEQLSGVAFGEEGVVKLKWQQRMVDEAKSASAYRAADSISAHPPKVTEGRAPSSLVSQRKAKAQNAK